MGWIVPCFLLSQAGPTFASHLCFEEQFIEELIRCFVLLARGLISCSSSLDFYNQAYQQVKPLGSVEGTVMLTPPRILERVKTVEYALCSFRLLRICLDV